MSPAEPIARGRVRLPDVLSRALGAVDGFSLETRIEPGAGSGVSVLRADGSPRILVPVELSAAGSGARSLAVLRVLPLSFRPESARGSAGAPPGRWRQEWMDLISPGRAESGVPRVHPGCPSRPRHAPVLPPMFYCRLRQAWIFAVCPGCGGPADEEIGVERCPSCGSPAAKARGGRPVPRTPLEALSERVHGNAPEDGLDPACVGCDHGASCFPPGSVSESRGKAAEVLQPISPGAWGGVVLEPVHVPLDAWCLLASGVSWGEVRAGLAAVPPALLEDADEFLSNERPFLAGPASKEALGLESLLLRLETLRQMLEGLRSLAAGMDHPHLGLAPETIWMRFEPPGNLRSALWAARLTFLDAAPAWGPGPSGLATARDPRPFLVPPECGREEEAVEGLSIARAAGAGAGDGRSVGIDFLPNSPLARPPAKGDAVVLRVRGPRTGEAERSLAARVEIGFPEVCRVLVSDPSLSPDEIRGLLTGASVTLRLERDHTLVDDLHAAGTLFLSSLLTRAGDTSEAAGFRDALAPRLKGAGGADGGETESLRALVSSGRFPVQSAPNPVESGAAPTGSRTTLDRGLAAKAVAFGMRLCAAIPGGYPGQGHEPVGRAERERGYDGLLSMLTAFSREVRERFLATAETGDAALAALGAYALERLKAPQARKPGGGRGPAAPKGRESR